MDDRQLIQKQLHNKLLNTTGIRSILVVVVSRFGDTLIATPLIRGISENIPNAIITVAAHPKRKEILYNIPYIHKLIPLTKNIAALSRIYCRKKKYDIAFLIEKDSVFTRYAIRCAKLTVGFIHNIPDIDDKLSLAVDDNLENKIHAAKHKLLLLEAIGIHATNLRLDYRPTSIELNYSKKILGKITNHASTIIIGIQTTSFHTKPFRNWPNEHFIELCNLLLKKTNNIRFLLFGGKKEKEKNDKISRLIGPLATNLSGISIRKTAAIMRQCNLLIGVDTGPTHIMGTMNIPLVGIYHCMLPSSLIGPIGHPHFIGIDLPAPDNGCSEQTMIKNITPSDVYIQISNISTVFK